jgi:hypothetical protein
MTSSSAAAAYAACANAVVTEAVTTSVWILAACSALLAASTSYQALATTIGTRTAALAVHDCRG